MRRTDLMNPPEPPENRHRIDARGLNASVVGADLDGASPEPENRYQPIEALLRAALTDYAEQAVPEASWIDWGDLVRDIHLPDLEPASAVAQ